MNTPGPTIATDLVIPYQVERAGLRGRFLRVGPLLNRILERHGYPLPVALLVAETVVLTALLGSTLKFEGAFTLQAHGKGPVWLIVADMTSDGELRAYAQFSRKAVAEIDAAAACLPVLLGQGHLAFTADQGPEKERYQGIVGLEGTTLTECVHHYFRQSEQIQAAIRVGVTRPEAASGGGGTATGWRAGAIMVQRLPGEGPRPDIAAEINAEEDEENWREAVTLMASVTDEELGNPRLPPDRLLYRLFHEPGVRMFQPRGLVDGCRCSRERVAGTLLTFPKSELLDMMDDGVVSVKCEFCGEDYIFDEPALEALFS
ncbi:MAG: Hsp33 family molecular chaperone HslO [Alphaproteobacteria bacterium]|nr:Hsp33 family molecular chaperone HslO [Alphaproteobacteria bacterium]